MSSQENSLPIPRVALNDQESKEIMRAWFADNEVHFTYRFGQWPLEIWGVFMSDLLKQIISSEIEENGTEPKAAVRTVMDRFIDELNKYGEELGFEERLS